MRGRIGRTCALALVAGIAWTGTAQAKTFEVTRTGDPVPDGCKRNDCSLREAVLRANARAGADVVVLPKAQTYNLTQPGAGESEGLTGDLNVLTGPLAISHPGKGRATIDGNDVDNVIGTDEEAAVTLRKLVVTGGSSTTDGGGIDSEGSLTLLASRLSGNETTDDGGALDGGSQPIVLRKSRVTGNDAGSTGGGLDPGDGSLRVIKSVIRGNSSLEEGGAIDLDGGAVIKKSTIANNTAVGGGGAIDHNDTSETLRIVASTISGNRSELDGGGLRVLGPVALITNSTIAGNTSAGNGGGIYASEGSDVSLNAVTVARNRAAADTPGPVPPSGGGIYQIDSTFEVRNTLIGLNTIGLGGIQRQDCEGETYTSLGNNLLSTDTECDGFTQPSDLVRSNPKIGRLKKNGGPTKTIALKRGSAAIGHAHKPSAPNRDQRGRKRDRNPDIGAFERGA